MDELIRHFAAYSSQELADALQAAADQPWSLPHDAAP
jgi:hypothetical protein